ncbi:MAG TPA: LLM class flavin-dependent oxidoreductase [Candidatus Binatia bacterium]|jgi:alkanesulfonate monooxygenase SsuD/methylene tetrahydromethanopterin reductase-like flavin-dependent oxidoreductase (luciferase family)|nr:LLM class flavin-dependent oxidoreductase [Candidatus Binatia bacterium]
MDRVALSFSPLRDALPADIVSWSRTAEERGFEGVYVPESFNDSLAYAQAIAMSTTTLHVGTAITNVYLRHPTLLAQQAAAVQEFSGGRLHLGLGVGHQVVNRSLGIEMGDAMAKMRDVIGVLRTAWVKGGHQPRPTKPPVILAAALAPKMIELVGELADGVIFNLFPLERYPKALAALYRGAERAGRDPQSIAIYHFTTCYLGPDRAACLHEAKRMLARYANLPFYGNMLAQSGFAGEVEAVRGHMKARDVAAAEQAVTDAMADAVTLVGDPAHCRERLRAYAMAGAATAIVFPNPVGEPRAAAVERAIDGLAPR